MASVPRSQAKAGRKRTPKAIAVIDRDYCTGCEACRQVCPVDCIALIRRATGVLGTERWCEVDASRCIGCKLCIRLPRRGSERDHYTLATCPWGAIELLPTG